MTCKCQRVDDRLAIVDIDCVYEMHRVKPPPFYGSEADRVPAGSMFDFGLYLADDKSVTFECGCTGDRSSVRDDWEWNVWPDCLVSRHPEM